MAGVPLTASNIEETNQKNTQLLEHILLRPDSYIGSLEKQYENLWVYEDYRVVQKLITYVPGLYKIFDEVLLLSAVDPKMDTIKVTIDVESNFISVYTNVPVEVHREDGVYVPELIFGNLLTNGDKKGYGVKLTNIFSKEFVIEIADGRRKKKIYKQVFYDNMRKKSEPDISNCTSRENWTKISFKPDLEKFSNMKCLEKDVVALMMKRVIDVAGCHGTTVKIKLNGQKFRFKSFSNYCDIYLNSAAVFSSDPLPRFEEKVHDRWQICVSRSEGKFQQVSFVNGISTVKGGTHVDYVTDKITSHLISVLKKKHTKFDLKPHIVKNHLWVFVHALIDNPTFDSPNKKTLTLSAESFGSSWEFSPDFLDKVAKSDIMKNIEHWVKDKFVKVVDAGGARSSNSHECTLIMTGGDSAKALAMVGLEVVGRWHYGVFPLSDKLLNAREANQTQIMENTEIQQIMQILGLEHGKVYDRDTVKSLRYGHLMIMTDQDHDGNHIKRLLINIIHSLWPSLLKIPSFMQVFITPIVKATNKDGLKKSFYTMLEYESWKESLGSNAKDWSIKYYKGLGTNTSEEVKEYFDDLGKHTKDFEWVDDNDGKAIELAFSENEIEARKSLVSISKHATVLDEQKTINYTDFIHNNIAQFSIANLQRSIPSMVDGLKRGQRKILFCAFKRNFVKEAKVSQFAGYVSEHSAYHHGEQSLEKTIIRMAQDYTGSNNINLFRPNGLFGTRAQGGKDHGSARYLFTELSDLTRYLYRKEDDVLLEYLNEDGQSVEPKWYTPIIPMVLVNGSHGIGTGYSSFIPAYNPRDLIANVRLLLEGKSVKRMHPWYNRFDGTIKETTTNEAWSTYKVSGVIKVKDDVVVIRELPIGRWTNDYKDFLESVSVCNGNNKDPFIEFYCEETIGDLVYFGVFMSAKHLESAQNEDNESLLKKFKLTTFITTKNMHLLDPEGVIKKYDNPEQILEEFFPIRLKFYAKRKIALLDDLMKKLEICKNKLQFISHVVDGSIVVSNKERDDLFSALNDKGLKTFPKKNNAPEISIVGATDDAQENDGYDYLLSMAISSLTPAKIKELEAERNKYAQELEQLKEATAELLWRKDLDELEKKLDEADEPYIRRKKNEGNDEGNASTSGMNSTQFS